MWTNLGYMHKNPVKCSYVSDAKVYLYSSAITYEDDTKGLLKIDLLPVLSSVEWKI